jgi:hypothetical protein
VRSVLAYVSRIVALRSARTSLAISLLTALGMCMVPLLGVHGAESALVLGVILPPLAALTAARIVHRARRARSAEANQSAITLVPVLGACLAFALLLFAVPTLVLALNALRVRNCTPLQGLAFMLLGPGMGCMLAAFSGMLVALLVTRVRLAGALALTLPFVPIALTLARFYMGPPIFAYGHFFGYFPGTLYDEGVTITESFLWLRVATSAWILGLALLALGLADPKTLRIGTRAQGGAGVSLAVAAVLLTFGVGMELSAIRLGQRTSRAHIAETLGGSHTSARCKLYFPRELSPADRTRLAEECDFRVGQAERWLGVTHPEPISVFLFRDPNEKYALMGAAGTNLAKPWRSEVYISESVARAVGRGPLRLSGRAGGLWPNPGLIEGVAVAAAFPTQGGLTPHEWARAMLELGMMPSVAELFGPSFLGQQKRLAYTLSGSLLRFLAETHGNAAVRRAYQSGDLSAALSQPLSAIEAQWHTYLRSLPLPASALAFALLRPQHLLVVVSARAGRATRRAARRSRGRRRRARARGLSRRARHRSPGRWHARGPGRRAGALG